MLTMTLYHPLKARTVYGVHGLGYVVFGPRIFDPLVKLQAARDVYVVSEYWTCFLQKSHHSQTLRTQVHSFIACISTTKARANPVKRSANIKVGLPNLCGKPHCRGSWHPPIRTLCLPVIEAEHMTRSPGIGTSDHVGSLGFTSVQLQYISQSSFSPCCCNHIGKRFKVQY